MDLKQLIHEIHRRSLWQVLGIYMMGGWVAYEVVQSLTEGLGLPDWFPGLAIVLLIVGLPIVLATAFVQEGIGAGSVDPDTHAPSASSTETDPNTAGEAPHERAAKGRGGARQLLTWRRAMGGGVLALALWGVVATAWLIWAPRAGALTGDGLNKSVAVLPFTNMSADEENAYFTQGVHDDILTQLSKISALDVIARTSVLQYADTEKGIPAIGAELGVSAVVEGGVQRSGSRVRLNVQLIHAESNTHLWAETYDRDLTAENIFSVQTEIAQQIAEALRATLTADEESRIASVPTASLSAYDFYLKGREAYRRYTAEDNDEAIRLFREALELDPEYARAWAGLGDAFGQRVERFGFPIAWADSAISVSRRAIQINPELADGYKALGLAYSGQGDAEQALANYRRTVELDPNHSAAVNNIGLMSFQRGAFDEYLRWSRRAFNLAPNDNSRRTEVAWAYWSLEDYDLAERWAQEALALGETDLGALDIASTLASHRGDFERGLELAERAVRAYPNSLHAHQVAAGAALFARDMERARTAAEEAIGRDASHVNHHWHYSGTMLGVTALATGDTARATRLLAEARERTEAQLEVDPSWMPVWDMASIYAALGNVDEAVSWAQRAYEERGYRFPKFIAIDPVFDGMRDDSRFQALIGRMQSDVDAMRREIELEEIAAGER